MPKKNNQSQILEGSRAIALTIKNIGPGVVSAYPITPQTHIVEDLAKFKADGEADFEYVRAESEFAAASIILGASAAGERVYSSTSSQGLLLMAEVIYNIAGMRLPAVITCANRAVSAPINIWNDHQDAMAIRDAGWIMLFAENHQEAVTQHILAYKIAEQLSLPVMVNVDGFILTHSYEEVYIPSAKEIKQFLPSYKPARGTYLNPADPRTLGSFASPEYYMEIRQELHDNLISSLSTIKSEFEEYKKIINVAPSAGSRQANTIDNGLIEYCGPKKAKTVLIAMGSVVGTIKDAVGAKNKNIGILKIKTYRPFPQTEILNLLKKINAEKIAVIEKAIGLGYTGPLYQDVKTALQGKIKIEVKNFIVGLGGRDVTKKMISGIIKKTGAKGKELEFIGKI